MYDPHHVSTTALLHHRLTRPAIIIIPFRWRAMQGGAEQDFESLIRVQRAVQLIAEDDAPTDASGGEVDAAAPVHNFEMAECGRRVRRAAGFHNEGGLPLFPAAGDLRLGAGRHCRLLNMIGVQRVHGFTCHSMRGISSSTYFWTC